VANEIQINGTDLFALCAFGGNATKQPISSATALQINGQTLNQRGAGIPTLAAVDSIYIYRNELYEPTGLLYSGTQCVFPNQGSRPTLWTTPINYWSTYNNTRASQTYYVVRGNTGNTAVTIGTSTALLSNGFILGFAGGTGLINLPNQGVKYVQIFMMGGGGGGAGAGGSLQHSGAGGGGGAAAVVCIRLPLNDYAKITLGYGGLGGTNYSDGNPGSFTRVDCGSFWCQCGGGAGGRSGSSSTNQSAGGAITYSGNNVDGYLQSYHNGGYGAAKNNTGESRSNLTFYEHTPENASVTISNSGGGSGGSSGGGGGGAGAGRYYSTMTAFSGANGGSGGNGAPGGDVSYGGGGGGGGVGFTTQHRGGNGGGGTILVTY
jgi:hypothetical protein